MNTNEEHESTGNVVGCMFWPSLLLGILLAGAAALWLLALSLEAVGLPGAFAWPILVVVGILIAVIRGLKS